MTSFRRTTYLLLSLFVFGFFCSFYAEAQRVRGKRMRGGEKTDSLHRDSVALDSLGMDSLAVDTTKKKEPLDAPVIYEASDSIVFTKDGYAHLYGEGKVNYQNIELTSAVITMNMDSSTVFAKGVADTTGVETGTPIFKDGETPYESKIMRYNLSLVRRERKEQMMRFTCVMVNILLVTIMNILIFTCGFLWQRYVRRKTWYSDQHNLW